jgi:hypothetical protein
LPFEIVSNSNVGCFAVTNPRRVSERTDAKPVGISTIAGRIGDDLRNGAGIVELSGMDIGAKKESAEKY